MNALGFAWRSLVRQPARAALGILGVAAVGALLLDMLLLSHGLIVSMGDLLDRTGYDVRVTATNELPRNGPRLQQAKAVTSMVAALPQVRAALAVRFVDARIDRKDGSAVAVSLQGVSGKGSLPWLVLRGGNPAGTNEVVVNQAVADALGATVGAAVSLRASCGGSAVTDAMPAVRLRIAGIAQFPFELTSENSVGGTLDTVTAACGSNEDDADLILVTSRGDAAATAAAIGAARSELSAVTNAEVLGRIQETGFTYFRQISTVLTTVTLSFALLLITVLLTVSVNQRLGEIAALRALGFSRLRVVADVLCESALMVGFGGLLSLPLGGLLAAALDRILKNMPGIPADLHFFVFEQRALVVHLALLLLTALVAALYPMRIVARLPIAATLRNEVIG